MTASLRLSDRLVGEPSRFPREIEDGIDQYLATQAAVSHADLAPQPMSGREARARYRSPRMFPLGR